MVSSARNPQRRFSVATCHAVFLTMLPAIQRHARIAFRHLRPEAKQEAVQNVLANTWAALVALARRGKLDLAYPSVLRASALRRRRTTVSSVAMWTSRMCSRRTAKRRRM